MLSGLATAGDSSASGHSVRLARRIAFGRLPRLREVGASSYCVVVVLLTISSTAAANVERMRARYSGFSEGKFEYLRSS